MPVWFHKVTHRSFREGRDNAYHALPRDVSVMTKKEVMTEQIVDC